ncbi:hypothetical protein V8C42DRAFT_252999 [Trichoderma barbatum]
MSQLRVLRSKTLHRRQATPWLTLACLALPLFGTVSPVPVVINPCLRSLKSAPRKRPPLTSYQPQRLHLQGIYQTQQNVPVLVAFTRYQQRLGWLFILHPPPCRGQPSPSAARTCSGGTRGPLWLLGTGKRDYSTTRGLLPQCSPLKPMPGRSQPSYWEDFKWPELGSPEAGPEWPRTRVRQGQGLFQGKARPAVKVEGPRPWLFLHDHHRPLRPCSLHPLLPLLSFLCDYFSLSTPSPWSAFSTTLPICGYIRSVLLQSYTKENSAQIYGPPPGP